MPSITRAVFLVLYAAALACLVGTFGSAPAPALASPIPVPLPLATYNAQLSALVPRLFNSSAASSMGLHDVLPTSTFSRRAADYLAGMRDCSGRITQNTQTINNLANQASTGSTNSAYRQTFGETMTEFHSNIFDFQTLFASLAADDGLQNYDNGDELETMLKDVVNGTKAIMYDLYISINAIPVLGPLLGPVVYEIKCIVDELLDTTENTTDEVINASGLAPLMSDLGAMVDSVCCLSGIDIMGICVAV